LKRKTFLLVRTEMRMIIIEPMKISLREHKSVSATASGRRGDEGDI